LKIDKITQGPSPATNVQKIGFNFGKKKEGKGQVASTIAHWEGHPSTRYRPEHSHISYTMNASPMYQQNVPLSTPVPRPPPTPHNVYPPKQPWKNEGGSNYNQTQGQNSFQRKDQIQYTPIPM